MNRSFPRHQLCRPREGPILQRQGNVCRARMRKRNSLEACSNCSQRYAGAVVRLGWETGIESTTASKFNDLQSIGWHRKRSKAMQNEQTDCKWIALTSDKISRNANAVAKPILNARWDQLCHLDAGELRQMAHTSILEDGTLPCVQISRASWNDFLTSKLIGRHAMNLHIAYGSGLNGSQSTRLESGASSVPSIHPKEQQQASADD